MTESYFDDLEPITNYDFSFDLLDPIIETHVNNIRDSIGNQVKQVKIDLINLHAKKVHRNSINDKKRINIEKHKDTRTAYTKLYVKTNKTEILKKQRNKYIEDKKILEFIKAVVGR